MGDQELCTLFLNADKIINDEIEGNLTMWNIINDPEFKTYCGSSKCRKKKEKIGGLSAYLFMKARVLAANVMETSDQYDEYFVMWLSDKLYNILKGKPKINVITLNEAYNKYLKKHIVESNHLDLLGKVKGLGEANLKHMKEFYKLLNEICKVIAYYNPKDKNTKKLINNSTNCSNQYKSLYKSVPKCYSYLHLLDNLKKTYYSFIDFVINKNDKKQKLARNLKTLTISKRKDDYFAKGFTTFDFNSSECKPKKPKKPDPPKQKGGQPKVEPSPVPPVNPAAPPPQNGSSSQTPQTGGSTKQIEPKNSKNNKENKGGASGNKVSQSGGNGSPGDRSSDSTSSTSGGSFDLFSPFREFLLNGTEIYNKAFQFIKETQEMLNDAKDQISNAYDNAMNKLKGAYSVSSSYFIDIISNISIQFNQVVTPPKPGNSGNSISQNNDQSQKDGGPSLPSTKDPLANHPPVTPPSTSQLSQTSSSLQPITQNPAKVNQINHKTDLQLVKSLSSKLNLKKPCSIFPTTWNGSEDCKPEIEFMNTTLVCCTSKQCSLTGISVTLILIPIILSIVYKYLSREWTKKSEKKTMKRVIKLVDGNRKTQIIISSSDRNKDLKPVINSAGRKKDPLLNIYKLMQADPIPFINLFFLLIFFVYKRKKNFLEL
ncbi:hypothetical protein YYE_04968 [Plasmodium vinckei vinckei]|uniref:PIR protein CIR protein n=1 Tax=Plasmodium vinckei vinckei TaxID=54757 RepID=A0A081I925_PLAVN|nr:hypothetical protein YYE_04968 [Plasmodium vinckei vinckei]